MDLSILKPTKSEIYGYISFFIALLIMFSVQKHFGGFPDFVTAIIVIVAIAIQDIISNISVDIEVSNKQ
jgi:multisubunit Na+/H+ antiporter MnhG subunit